MKKRYTILLSIFILILVVTTFFIVKNGHEKSKISDNNVDVVDFNKGTDERIKNAMEQLKTKRQEAKLITHSDKSHKKLELIFEGLADRQTLDSILTLLKKHDTKATFFVSGLQAAEDEESIKLILDSGHAIGNYTLRAQKNMQNFSEDKLLDDFARAENIIYNITGSNSDILKCNTTKYTKNILEVILSLEIDKVIDTPFVLDINSFRSLDQAQGYVDRLKKGSIVSIKVNELIDESEYMDLEKDEKPAEDKKPQINDDKDKEKEPNNIVNIVEWILTAIDNTNYDEVYEDLRLANKGEKAVPISEIRTVQRAVSFMFYDIGKNKENSELNSLLEALDKLRARATFFVTASEIINNEEAIDNILKSGHELGTSVLLNDKFDYYEAMHQIISSKNLLKEKFDYDAALVIQPWAELQEETLEAVSASEMKIVAHDFLATKHDANINDVKQAMREIFPVNIKALKRGENLLFRLNHYDNKEFLSDLVYGLAIQKTTYPIVPINEIINNTNYHYVYPVPEDEILQGLKNKIYKGQLPKGTEDIMDIVYNRYIGNAFTKDSHKLPGFSDEEIEKIDKIGRITNDDNTVFLSFDDWGSDIAIDNILYVLKKHNVKASFLIRTNHVKSNPNLLRAIALDGHDIASHTHEHLTLSNYTSDKEIYTTLTDMQAKVLEDDIVKSFDVLKSIIGDVSVKGVPALKTYFRPPTLAVSKAGLLSVFDCGYDYSISGDFSTGDYEAKSVDEILKLLNHGYYSDGGHKLLEVQSGSIIVMHMSDESKYTAKALDIYLTQNEQKKDDDPTKFKFARLSDYLK